MHDMLRLLNMALLLYGLLILLALCLLLLNFLFTHVGL